MDDPNITMEKYIRLEEEKARRRGKVYNWETAMYGNIRDDEDVHDLRSVETGFPAIVFNDTLTSETAFSCEPTVSSFNNDEIDFRISFDESDDEDCTVKMHDPNITMEEYIRLEEEKARRRGKVYNWETATYVFNDTLTSEAALSCEPTPTVSYFDDLDFFKDFENKFPAIVYNDALTSKLDFLTEPT
ncbi:hypothetical protein Tco_0432500, partial [Tanacetum coccineum]